MSRAALGPEAADALANSDFFSGYDVVPSTPSGSVYSTPLSTPSTPAKPVSKPAPASKPEAAQRPRQRAASSRTRGADGRFD
jgi:hypothetical protein